MGRHRLDPRGHGRYVVAIGAVVLLLILLGVGGYALYGALTGKSGGPASPTPTPSASISLSNPP